MVVNCTANGINFRIAGHGARAQVVLAFTISRPEGRGYKFAETYPIRGIITIL